jgi:phospholipid transport system substrate-binding protein
MDRHKPPFLNRREVLLALTLLSTGAGLSVQIAGAGAATAPEKYVQRIGDDVIALANSGARGGALRTRFASLLQRHSDIRSIALFSLGIYQKKLPSGLRSQYFELVMRYAAGFFAYYVDDFAGSGFDVKASKPQGKAIIVESSIRYSGGRSAPVKWRVVNAGGGYRVNDVNVRGIWLSLQMQQLFTSVLKRNKGDFPALLDYLRKNA